MPVKFDKITGRLHEKDEHKCVMEVSCAVPQITLEMQLRKTTEVAIANRTDSDGTSLGTRIQKTPARGNYDVKRKAKGEWVIYVRYFGDVSTLTNPHIGILHKSRLYKCTQAANPNYGVDGNPDSDIEVFVTKTQTQGMWLMHDEKSNPRLIDLPVNEGEWTPIMQVDQFVELFMQDEKFKAQKTKIGDRTKWSQIHEYASYEFTKSVNYSNDAYLKSLTRALYMRAGLTVVQERQFIDPVTERLRMAYTYSQPLYFTLRYAPKGECSMHLLI